MVLVFMLAGITNAALTTIGTATYNGTDYNLIYEDDSISGGLVWLDYSNAPDNWDNQVSWASGLGGSLTVNLDPLYTTDIDWTTGWRLPVMQLDAEGDLVSSEMVHLFNTSLGNSSGPGVKNYGDFDGLSDDQWYHWSGTEKLGTDVSAWAFWFRYGYTAYHYKIDSYYALAVHPGEVSVIPIPSALWLLGSGLIGIVGVRRKIKK